MDGASSLTLKRERYGFMKELLSLIGARTDGANHTGKYPHFAG